MLVLISLLLEKITVKKFYGVRITRRSSANKMCATLHSTFYSHREPQVATLPPFLTDSVLKKEQSLWPVLLRCHTFPVLECEGSNDCLVLTWRYCLAFVQLLYSKQELPFDFNPCLHALWRMFVLTQQFYSPFQCPPKDILVCVFCGKNTCRVDGGLVPSRIENFTDH